MKKGTGPSKKGEVVEKPLTWFKPAAYNPRKDLKPGDVEYDNLRRSVEHFGPVQILVANKNGTLIGGHQTLKVLKDLKFETARCMILDLPTAEEKALNVALNKIRGDWDFHKLTELLVELDTGDGTETLTGFTDEEVKEMVDYEKSTVDPGTGAEEGEIIEPPKNPKTRAGDLWRMGKHVLLCGDCRVEADMARLFAADDGAHVLANVVVTSPPYASQRKYDPSSGFKPIAPDDYVGWWEAVQAGLAKYLASDGSFFLNIKEHCEEGQRHLYVKDLVARMVRGWGWRWVDEFAWVHGGTPKAVVNRFKNGWEPIHQFTRGDHKFRPDDVRHESDDIPDWEGAHPSQEDGLAMQGKDGIGGRQGQGLKRGGVFTKKIQRGPNMASNQGAGRVVIDVDTKTGLAYPSNVLSLGKNREALGHGAAYPVSLPEFFIKAYSDIGDIVFDPFMGSGSTLVAAEHNERRCLGMEISPAYCDVIIHRWEDVTGEKAEREAKKGGSRK